jgi:hypothetical protein
MEALTWEHVNKGALPSRYCFHLFMIEHIIFYSFVFDNTECEENGVRVSRCSLVTSESTANMFKYCCFVERQKI